MGLLKLAVRFTWLLSAAFAVVAIGALHPARAESGSTRATLALSAEPNAARPALLDAPDHQSAPGASAAQPEKHGSPWWLWVLIAAGAAGVGALVVTSAGKDPACPAGRNCQ